MVGVVVVAVIAFELIGVIPLIGFGADVVVRVLMTFGLLLSVAIVIIPATHVVTNIANQIITL